MGRTLGQGKLVVASHNPGKAREINELLAPHGIEAVSAAALDLDEPEETGDSFAANALIKAEAAVRASGLTSLADDSGLVVPSLGGAPGIHSARWAGPHKDFMAAMERVWRELDGAPDQRAHFISTLVLAWPDGHAETFEGRVDGTLIWPPRGSNGFGYDPMFAPDGGRGLTFGELPADEKHALSHRARAFDKLVAACLTV